MKGSVLRFIYFFLFLSMKILLYFEDQLIWASTYILFVNVLLACSVETTFRSEQPFAIPFNSDSTVGTIST